MRLVGPFSVTSNEESTAMFFSPRSTPDHSWNANRGAWTARSSTVGLPFSPLTMRPSSVKWDRGVRTVKPSKNQPPGPRPKRPRSGSTESSGAWPIQEMRSKLSAQRTGT